MKRFWEELAIVAKLAPRRYFAPIVGAVRGIRNEYREIREAEKAAWAARSKADRELPQQ